MTTRIPSKPPAGALRGITLMAVAMMSIPLVDGLAKHLSQAHSPLFVSWARYVAACLIVLPVAVAMRGRDFLPRSRLWPHVLRTAFLMSAMTLYFLAIARIPLATAISAYFVGPIIATVLAVFFLGERVTLRKGAALLFGIAGTIVILRPTGDIEPGLLLALASGAFFALYMIATRMASLNSDPVQTLAFQCLFGAMILTPQAVWAWSAPVWQAIPLFGAMGVLSAFSHFLSIAAFRHAEASTLAPLVYLELVSSAVIGYAVFGDLPGLAVWAGAAMIVLGGLLLIERRKTRGF